MTENVSKQRGVVEMDNKVADQTTYIAANIGAGVTGAASLWAWLGTNHDSITAVCAIIGGVIAIVGACINGYHRFIKNHDNSN